MKELRSVLPLLAILISDPSSAFALDCDVPPIDIAIRQATAILTGQVTRMEVTEVTGVLRVTVNVRETFKGQPDRNFTIRSYGASIRIHSDSGRAVGSTGPNASRFRLRFHTI